MSKKFGITNLKIAVVAAITLAEKIEKNLADDGKISFGEALGIGARSFRDVLKIIKSGSEIKYEFLDLDKLEKDELLSLVKQELDLVNNKIEEIVENSIEFLISLEKLIDSIK